MSIILKFNNPYKIRWRIKTSSGWGLGVLRNPLGLEQKITNILVDDYKYNLIHVAIWSK